MPTSIIRDNHPVKRGRRIHPDRRPLSSELSRYSGLEVCAAASSQASAQHQAAVGQSPSLSLYGAGVLKKRVVVCYRGFVAQAGGTMAHFIIVNDARMTEHRLNVAHIAAYSGTATTLGTT